jgi:PAS domain S-box-containing protein
MISVLYVDDEPDLLELGKTYLEKSGGFTVTTIRSASEALDLMAGQKFDLVLSDYQMPDLDGITFLKEVRWRYGGFPFILFTGRGREEIVIEAINNGADFYLQKGGDPLAQFTELAHKITIAVERRQAYEQIKAQEEELRRHLDEMVRAQQEQAKTEENFKILVDNAPDAIYIQTNNRFRYLNNAALRLMGAGSADQLLGTDIYDRIDPRIHGIVRERVTHVLADHPVELLEESYLKLDGTPVSVEVKAVPFRFWGEQGALVILRDITNRKRAEEALRESEEKYRTLVEQSQDGVFIVQDGRLVFYNHAFAGMTGYDEKELIGRSIAGLIAPGDRETAMSRYQDRVSGRPAPSSYEFSVLHRDGSTPVRVRMFAGLGSYQGRLATIGTFHDITGEREREEALRESELRFRRLFEHSFDAAVIHRDGRIVYANDQAARLMRVPGPEDLTGKGVMDFVDPVSEQAVRERIRSMIVSPENIVPPIEERFRRPDGTILDVEVIASPTVYQQKPAVLALFRDISERKTAEAALKESEKRYRQILQHASDAIIIHEVTETEPGRLVEVNEKACRMLGYTREELLGMSISDIDAPEQAKEVPGIQRILFSGGTALFQAEHVTKDGKRIPVEVSNSLITLDGRQMVLAMIRDMQVQKRNEQVLRETNRKLALLSSITRHDLRNKVTLLSGYLALAKEKSADPAMTASLEKLESITASVREHIEFTKIYEDLGSVEPRWQEVRAAMPGGQVPKEVRFEDGLPAVAVYADPILPRVFSNLIDNTIRHGKHATAIRVTAAESPDGLVITYEDDGDGIPENEKEKIFRQGYGKNTGLGLFLSREILAITRIGISETGEPGKGARFEMLVPKGAYRFTGTAPE